MNHYLFLLSSEWSLPPTSPLQKRAAGQMSDTRKHGHLCARCAASHAHEPPELFPELTAASLPGVRQNRRCSTNKRHDAFSSSSSSFSRAPEHFPCSRDRRQLWNHRQRGDAAVTALVATPGSRCNDACRPKRHSFGHQINGLPSLWALFAHKWCWKPNSFTIPSLLDMKD